MQNVKMSVKGNVLSIEVDLSKEFGASKSGKTIQIGSTLGNKKVEGKEVWVGLNVYKYPDEGKK